MVSGHIVRFWKQLGQELNTAELSAYSDNGPVRRILRDILKTPGVCLPQEMVEVGALYKPFCFEVGNFSRALLIDPIYAEKDPPRHGQNVVTSSTPLPEALDEIRVWLRDGGVLFLENVINYFEGKTVDALLQQNFSHIIIGNNSSASFGDKHPLRLKSPQEIQNTLFKNGFSPTGEIFLSKDTLAGVYVR